ncbi:MAG: DUF1289 domain-containing protein [Pseudomonadota bacterium]
MESPCVDVCILDDASGMCVGCGRTGDEIAHWVSMSSEERRAIMEGLPARMKELETGAKTALDGAPK